MGVRALCFAGVLACVPRAFAQAPGPPTAPLPTAPGPSAPVLSPSPAPAARDVPEAREAAPAAPQLANLRLAPPPSAAGPAPSERSGLSPTIFWIAASTTIIVASLGGFEALHVRDLYDQAIGVPAVSPERDPLHDRMRTAEITADVLLLGSLALAVGTTILAFHTDWSARDGQRDVLARRRQPSAAGRRWW
jgi:hypothetical protein